MVGEHTLLALAVGLLLALLNRVRLGDAYDNLSARAVGDGQGGGLDRISKMSMTYVALFLRGKQESTS